MGGPGDHPITDLIYYGQDDFPPDIADMLRKLHSVDPGIRDGFALDASDWVSGRNLEEGRTKLTAELCRLGISL